jgi:O-antigen ligase
MFIERLCIEFKRRWPATPASWLIFAVTVYVFLAPNVDFAPHLTWHDGQRIAQLVLMAVVVLVGFVVPGARKAIANIWMALSLGCRITLFAAFSVGAVSAMRAELLRWALLEWAILLLVLVVALGVAAGRKSGGEDVDTLLVAVVAATAIAYSTKTVVVYAAMLAVGEGYGVAFNVRDLFTGFSNIRFFGHVQTMLLPFLLLPAMWWATNWRQRVVMSAVPALWWMLVAASGSRGTWAGLAVGALAVLLAGGRPGRRWINWQIAGMASGLTCYAVFVLLVPAVLGQPVSFLHRSADITSLSLREVIWTSSIKFIIENPLLGIGPMHFSYYANTVAAHPHNALLQFAVEWGLPAALLFTGVFAAGGLAFVTRVKRMAAVTDNQAVITAVALLAALAGATTQAMVDGVLVMPVSQITFALICGWALGLYFSQAARPRQCSTLENMFCVALILLAVGSVIYGVLPEVGRLEQREAAYLADRPPGTLLLPRFWAQGWINR